MRGSRTVLGLASVAFTLSSCIVDASWLDLVGRWQDAENPTFELEFTQGGRFSEYMFGEVIGYGEFRAEGRTITLHYLSPCGGQNQVSCDVSLRFHVAGTSLTITDAQGELFFTRIGAAE